MAETVYRHIRRRRTWMMDGRRLGLKLPERVTLHAVLAACGQGAPGFLLALADVMDMPSGLYAAYVASLAALGLPVRWAMTGAAAAQLLRAASGLALRWEHLLTLLLLLPAPRLLKGRRNPALLLATGLSLAPMVIRGWLAPTALPALLTTASLGLSVLLAPVICRGVKAVLAVDAQGRPLPLTEVEDRLGVAVLALMMLCGGAQVRLAGMNAGMALACAAVMALAIALGAGAGCAAGIAAGLSLALAGLPGMMTIALAAGGFLAGVMQATERRWLSCASFGTAALLTLVLTGEGGSGCAAAMTITTTAAMLLPGHAQAWLRGHMQRLRSAPPPMCDAYAASTLTAWEQTMVAMTRSVPMAGDETERRDGAWWRERLCAGCPEGCGCFGSEAAVNRAEEIWRQRQQEEGAWQEALEALRGLGCQRLFHLRQGMEALRREDALRQRHASRAREQRAMLVTHLTAIAGAARRFANLSLGESWWDTLNAQRIRAALSDAAAPMRLMWLRRVEGHVEAVFLLEDLTDARRQAEALCDLTAQATGTPMIPVSIDGGRVRIAQQPPLQAVCGVCSICSEGQQVCGDTAWQGLLQDGRFMAAVSDGMGHGETAALSSRQTVELLRLCLDAGYTLAQTLTAVNGMMLLGGSERFIAVDMLCLDLWTGRATLTKLGSAESWLQQGNALTVLTGDALPLGILEGVDAMERTLQLGPGDALVMMSDGVEEAFASQAALEAAVGEALTLEPADAAVSLMQAAAGAAQEKRRDDQTVLVLRIRAVQNG